MFEIFFWILFLIPAMLGLAEILHFVKLYILKPKKAMISYKVVILTNDTAVENMRYAIEQYLWQAGRNGSSLIFVNSLLNKEIFFACKEIAERYDVGFYSKKELEEYLNLIVV